MFVLLVFIMITYMYTLNAMSPILLTIPLFKTLISVVSFSLVYSEETLTLLESSCTLAKYPHSSTVTSSLTLYDKYNEIVSCLHFC